MSPLLALLLPLLLLGCLWQWTLAFPPQWAPELLPRTYRRLAHQAAASGALMEVAAYSLYHHLQPLPRGSLTGVLGLLTFSLVVSLATDTALRKVDRRLLWLTILLTAPVGCYLAWHTLLFPVFLFAGVMVCLVLLFLPGMGASDARAFLLLVVTVLPVGGPKLLLASVGLALVAMTVASLLENLLGGGSFLRNHLPAVPYIIGSGIIAIAAFPLLPPDIQF